MKHSIPIYKPYFPEGSLRYAHDAIDSTWVSSSGKYIELATNRLKEVLKVEHLQLVNNGTSATHLIIKSLLFKNPNIKKVIVPNNVYVAAWNAMLYEGVELIPIDADEASWNINLNKLPRELSNDTAICLVNNIGGIINTPNLVRRYGIEKIIEDNCEGFMGMHEESYSGTKSLASSISFFGNKTITSGEGGAVILSDGELLEYVNSLHGQGQCRGTRYIHDKMAYNYRMTNVQAAILLGQLEILPDIVNKKENIFNIYRERFSNLNGVEIQKINENTVHSNWMMGIRITGNDNYESAKAYLSNKGIDTRPMFYPMSSHRHLKEYSNPDDENVAKILSKECLLLPSFPELKNEEIYYIIQEIDNFINKKD
jgi:perosamine synthetase